MASPSPEKTPAETNASPAAASNTPAPKPKPKPKTWNLKNFVEFFGVEEDEVYEISEALTRVMQSRPLPNKTLQTKSGKEEIENFLRSNISELPAFMQNAGDDVDVMEALKGLFRRILTQKFQYLRKPPAKAGESSGSGKADKKNAAGDGKKSKKVNDGKAGAAGEKEAEEEKKKPEAKDEVSEEDDSSDEYETETDEDEEEPKKPENAPDAKGKARASAEHVVNTSSNNTSKATEETSSESGSDSDTISRSTSEKPKPKAGNKKIIIKRRKRTLTLYTSNHHSTNMTSNNTPETTTIKTTITNAPPVMEVNIPEPRTKRVKLSSRSDRILDLLENGTIWALNEPHPNSNGLVSIQELLAQPESTEEPKVTDLDFQAWVNSVKEQCGYNPSLHRLEYRAPEKVLPLVGGQQACVPIIAVEQWRAVLKAHAASGIATDPVFYLVESRSRSGEWVQGGGGCGARGQR